MYQSDLVTRMLERVRHDIRVQKKWPYGTRSYEVLISNGAEALFDMLNREKKWEIKKILSHRSLCVIRCYRFDHNGRKYGIDYHVDTENPKALYESVRGYASEFLEKHEVIEEDDLLATMTILDGFGQVYKLGDPLRFMSRNQEILSSEISNLILNSICELIAVRWMFRSGSVEEFVYLNLEDTRYLMNMLKMPEEMKLIGEFKYVSIN